MNEIWKDVVGYEDSYMISNIGNIKSKTRCRVYPDGHVQSFKGKQLHPYTTSYGYLAISLTDSNKKRTHKHIHDLVADAFIPNPLGLKEVNHKDLNKKNNNVDNLEWCTHKENMNHMFDYYVNVPNHRYHRRIIGKHFYCVDCGCEILPTSKRCDECSRQHRREQPPLTRQNLKQLIRTKSFLAIGKDFLVSDNTIRKWCKKYQLPYRASDIKKYTEEEWQMI